MRVIDFFCGAGGFSEGFRLAGFDVIWAVDKWLPAVKTHRANHPDAVTVHDDVIRISFLPDDEFDALIPDSEIIIGSPPCVAFSSSNKSGNGEKAEGIRLIEAYLRIVARKKAKPGSVLQYWLLENVPRVEQYIKPEYTASDLGLEGDFVLCVKSDSSGVYDGRLFGVPSKRLRYICGEFPKPLEITKPDEVQSLGAILRKVSKESVSEGSLRDPNYPDFSLRWESVTDVDYTLELAEHQWGKSKRLKQDKGYMGRMAFPENLNQPSRTVMANCTHAARESMVLPLSVNRYRSPTIRELATLMSFPLDYLFVGDSKGLKHTLVGNSVPPKMARAFGNAMRRDVGLDVADDFRPSQRIVPDDFVNLNGRTFPISEEKQKHPHTRFKYHIPYLIEDRYRVELTNVHSDFANEDYQWAVEIHWSQGKGAKTFTPKPTSIDLNGTTNLIDEFIDGMKHELPDLNSLQAIWCLPSRQRIARGKLGPEELLERVRDFVSEQAPGEDVELMEPPFCLPHTIALGYLTLNRLMYVIGGDCI